MTTTDLRKMIAIATLIGVKILWWLFELLVYAVSFALITSWFLGVVAGLLLLTFPERSGLIFLGWFGVCLVLAWIAMANGREDEPSRMHTRYD